MHVSLLIEKFTGLGSHNEIKTCHCQKSYFIPNLGSTCHPCACYWHIIQFTDEIYFPLKIKCLKEVTQEANVLVRAYSCISKFMHSTMHTSLHLTGFHIHHALVPEGRLIYF